MSKRAKMIALLAGACALAFVCVTAAFAEDPVDTSAPGVVNTGTEVPFEPTPGGQGGEGGTGEGTGTGAGTGEGTGAGTGTGEGGESATNPGTDPETPDTPSTNPETNPDPASGTDAEADPAITPGANPSPGTSSPDAESGAEADTNPEPEPPAKPYSTLTPVGGADNPDNAVNTHQLPDSSFLYDTSLADLADANPYHDGQTVQIIGEVVGDILRDGASGSHVWVTLASIEPESDATVAVYMPAASAAIIDTLGAYGKTGTILQVRGTFYLACPDHEGVSDIHVENVNVVSPGTTTSDVFSWQDFTPGIVLLAMAGLLLLVFHLLRQRLR